MCEVVLQLCVFELSLVPVGKVSVFTRIFFCLDVGGWWHGQSL